MHSHPKFRWDDRDELRAFVNRIGFGAVVSAAVDGLRVAHVPAVFLDQTRLGFHVARGNAIARDLDGARAVFVVQGPNGYVSPDWHGFEDQVPTWNYLAVELEGIAHKLDRDGLVDQLDRLSAEHEARLAPKQVWTRAKMTPGRFDKMLDAITGFSLEVADWHGTRKLGQLKPEAARGAAADGVAAAGNSELADLMRTA